ncbi:MAG: hypothetical protein ABI995_00975 [Acidobacteriota bacterium]
MGLNPIQRLALRFWGDTTGTDARAARSSIEQRVYWLIGSSIANVPAWAPAPCTKAITITTSCRYRPAREAQR